MFDASQFKLQIFFSDAEISKILRKKAEFERLHNLPELTLNDFFVSTLRGLAAPQND